MRNASKFLAILGVATVAVAVATPAEAGCPLPKTASTFTSDVANYVYVDLDVASENDVTGSFNDLGTATSGTYPAADYMFVDVGGNLSMSMNLGDARINGCPTGKLIVRLQSSTATGTKFVTMVANEGVRNPSGADFDFTFGKAPGTVFEGATVPRPRVNSAARAGTNVNLNVALDSTASANAAGDSSSAVTGYEILRAAGTDPGRNPAGWTLVTTVGTSNGGAVPSVPLVADCSNPAVDQFFATRVVMGTQKSDLVSASTRVNCNPNLAEPRFNVVPKKPVGPKKNGGRE
jgi:hypothetical protein